MYKRQGEIDAYDGVTAAAMELFSADPASYTLNSIPATRLQFYILNENTLSDPVRAAINLAVDPQAIAEFLKGTVTPAIGPFSPSASYGPVSYTHLFRKYIKFSPLCQARHRTSRQTLREKKVPAPKSASCPGRTDQGKRPRP